MSHDRIMEILADALELLPSQRPAFLDRACGGDSELRAEVERLLAADKATAFPTIAAKELLSSHSAAPTQVGPYRVVREIGRGGMGVVYLAAQTQPVQRQVAIKIIQFGMSSAAVLARFNAERQALAMMNHPGVAAMYDAGVTDTGRPYFVMEFVDGLPITEFCDKNRLDTRARIELFIEVCEAVQHAHQKAIIHRDIKPSNVLVAVQDGKPVAKVIDFGIAKAIEQRLTEKTIFTEHGQLVGTPEYMSPEQASMGGVDIDTRSDVYSLGVLLYELLTGALPFDRKALRESAFDEIRRIIREVDPPKPSTRLSSLGAIVDQIAAARSSDATSHRKVLRGELDWITMRALEKDRNRRYSAPAELAADLSRHLRNEAVNAGPPSRIYRARKFVRRHRFVVMAASLIAASLIAGIAVSTWQMTRARRAEASAHKEEQRARAAELTAQSNEKRARDAEASAKKRFDDLRNLVGTFIFEIDTIIQDQGPTAARKKLNETAQAYLEQLSRETTDNLLMNQVMNGYLKVGLVRWYPGYAHLGDPKGAAEAYEKALSIARQLVQNNPDNPRTSSFVAKCLLWVSKTQLHFGKHEEALQSLSEARATFDKLKVLDPSIPDFARNAAMAVDYSSDVYKAMDDGPRAIAAVQEALPMYEDVVKRFPGVPEFRRDVMVASSGLASLRLNSGLPGLGIPNSRRSVEVMKAFSAENPNNEFYRNDIRNESRLLSELLLAAGFVFEPLQLMPPIVEHDRKILKDDSANVFAMRELANSLRTLGQAQLGGGKYDDALKSLAESITLYDRTSAADANDRFSVNEKANNLRFLASALLAAGQIAEAKDRAIEAVALHRKIRENDPPGDAQLSVSLAERVLAEVLLAGGDVNGAIEHLEIAAKSYPPPMDRSPEASPYRREFVFVLAAQAEAMLAAQKYDETIAKAAETRELADAIASVGKDDLVVAAWRARAQLAAANALLNKSNLDEAKALAEDALAASQKLIDADGAAVDFRIVHAVANERLGDIAAVQKDFIAASAAYDRCLEGCKTLLGGSPNHAAASKLQTAVTAKRAAIKS